jgi:uncharacterized protein (UPF0147 family)
MKDFQEVIGALTELENDASVPKNIKNKINEMLKFINESSDKSLKINKLLHELEEISSDVNLQPFIRTQFWNISSMLEAISS